MTVENVGKLDREVGFKGKTKMKGGRSSRGDYLKRGLSVEGNVVGDERSGERPKLERRAMDSERTVTRKEL